MSKNSSYDASIVVATPSSKIILLHLMGGICCFIAVSQLPCACLSVFPWQQLLLSVFAFFLKNTNGAMKLVYSSQYHLQALIVNLLMNLLRGNIES